MSLGWMGIFQYPELISKVEKKVELERRSRISSILGIGSLSEIVMALSFL
jgi:hypothetical protein